MKCIKQDSPIYRAMEHLNFTEVQRGVINGKIYQPAFDEWYGKADRDVFGDPKIYDNLYIVNEKGHKIRLWALLNDDVYNKRANYLKDLTYIDKVVSFLQEERVAILKRIKSRSRTVNQDNLKAVYKDLLAIDDNDHTQALMYHYKYISDRVEKFEQTNYKFDKLNYDDLSDKRKLEYEESYKSYILELRDFLNSFKKISKLEIPEHDISDEKQGWLQGTIIMMKDIESKISALENSLEDNIDEQFRKTFTKYIHNPEVRAGTIDFLASQTDISKMSLFLDAMGDSNNRVLQAIDKFYKINMFNKDKEVRQKQRKWEQFVNKIGDFDGFLDRVLEKIDGNRTGRLINEYDYGFYDTLFSYIGRLQQIAENLGKTSPEYLKLQGEYFDWKNQNQRRKYVDAYYDRIDQLIPEARQAKSALDEQRDAILKKGLEKLTVADLEELEKIKQEVIWLKSKYDKKGKLKTGKDLEIADSLFNYGRATSEMYEATGRVYKAAYDKAEAEAKAKGEDFHKKWLKQNNVESYTKEFWEEYNRLSSYKRRTKALDHLEEEMKQILLPYKNAKGEVETDNIPKHILEHYNKLENTRSQISKNSPSNASTSVKKALNKLVTYVPSTYYKELAKRKQKELKDKKITLEQYQEWYRENHEFNDFLGNQVPKRIHMKMRPKANKHIMTQYKPIWMETQIKPEYLNDKGEDRYMEDSKGYPLPKTAHKNKNFKNLSDSDKQNLEELNSFLNDLVAHNGSTIISKGYIPTFESIKRAKQESTTDKIVSESSDIVRFIPFHFINLLNQLEMPEITADMTEEQIKETLATIKKLKEQNLLAHGKALNYDLKNTMESFINSALSNKYKNNMELDLLIARERLKAQKVIKDTPTGKILYDKVASKEKKKPVPIEVSAIDSNTLRRLDEWLESVFYEDWEKEEGNFQKAGNIALQFSSFKGIAFNVLSGVNNKLIGNMMERIEAAGGEFFNYKDFRKARKLYGYNLPSIIADFQNNFNKEFKTKKASTLLTAIMNDFNITIDQTEIYEKSPEGAAKYMQHKLKMLYDFGYFMQKIGEHQVQNASLISMMQSHRIVDGKLMTFNEFIEGKKLSVSLKDKQEAKENILKNKQIVKEAKEEFEKYTQLIDAFELVGGFSELKQGISLNEDELANFKLRVIGINHKLHGIYNREDDALLRRSVWGRLAMQFRRYMRPTFNKRFAEKAYHENIRAYEEGMYRTSIKYIGGAFIDSYEKHKEERLATMELAKKVLFEGVEGFFKDSVVRWHTMSETEKANVRRTAAEMGLLIAVLSIGYLVKNMKGDDDDDIQNKAAIFALYQCDRLVGELSTFNFGLIRETNRLFKSPSPVFNTLEDLTKLLGATLMYPIRSEEERKFKSGIYHGEEKLEIYLKDMIPFLNQYQRMYYMNENNARYGFFR